VDTSWSATPGISRVAGSWNLFLGILMLSYGYWLGLHADGRIALPGGRIDTRLRQVLHLLRGEAEPETVVERGHLVERDGDVLARP
jgi:hypothetical protein